MSANANAASQPNPHGRARSDGLRLFLLILHLLACKTATLASEDGVFDPDASAEEILDALLKEPDEPTETSLWQAELELRLGCGHADNVRYSPFDGQDSVFSTSEGELFAYRQSGSRHYLSFYAFGSHRHHFELEQDNNEHTAIAQGGWEYRGPTEGAFGLRGTYYFFDQFFDASVSDIETDATRLTQHDAGASTYIRHALHPRLTAEVGSAYRYAALERSSDDYSQWEASTSLEGKTSSGLTFALGYRYRLDDYDERMKRTAGGEALPGDTVNIANYEARLYGSWFWDDARKWKTRWRVATRMRDDNGGGYYDYGSWQGGIGTAGKWAKWNADISANYTDTKYDSRQSDIFETLSAPLHRQRWDLRFRLERELGKRWRLFAEVEWEENDANDPLDAYDHFSGVAGVGYSLTKGGL